MAASLAPAVTAVRAPRFDRMVCDSLADCCTAAAARREPHSTPPECCTQVAQTRLINHMQHDCCWQVRVPVDHEQLRHGPSGPGQLARHARARRRGQRTSWTTSTSTSSCTRRAAVRDPQSRPTCSTPGERPPRDLSIGMRIVGAGSERLARAAPADELGCCYRHARSHSNHCTAPAL